jgi:hypothetical protein
MGSNDGAVNHGVFVVRILRQNLENPLPHASPAPARVTGEYYAEVTKALRQVTPGNACAVAVQHRIHEQPVVSRSGSGLCRLAGQQILDARPTLITQGISSGHASSHALCSLTFKCEGTLIDDTP